jgi:hypothetical protein
VEAFARNHRTPIRWAEKGVRKEDYVLPWLRRMLKKDAYGVYFIYCPWSVRGRGRSRRAKTDELHPMLPFCPPPTPRQRTRTDSEAVRRPRNRPFGQQPGAHVLSDALAAVRTYQSRPGVSLNLEQQVIETVGFFARAGLADGNVEP